MRFLSRPLIRGCMLILAGLMTQTALALETVKLHNKVYALVGPLEQRSENNLGNNANFGFVITNEGVVLIDSGGTLKGAQAIEAKVREVTDQPIIRVINTGGQDHRWFGNSYFTAQGAVTLTSEQTQADQQKRLDDQILRIKPLVGAAWEGTDPQPAMETISDTEKSEIGGVTLILIPAGPTHTGGETLVWLPDQEILFSGDLVYVDRMLNVGPQSQHKTWLEAFEQMAALEPSTIVPGHGKPTDLATATRDTYDYLRFLREQVGQLIDEGEDIQAISGIDQSAFSYLEAYEDLHGANAQRVYEEMEWE